ncbi:MAG: PhnD/SsuA/transferrin family substrate-binding protein [Bradymonadaceae bacterium]|nr:PhnD/SsuA/transferrin family substrate-binding protein [Lujinxingiaceae bacterium]
MAELFLARERGIAGLERLVVIKRILPHLADQPSFVEMFTREARFVAGLSHPNVVQIYDLGQEETSYHIAMEYINGSTLRELQLLAEQRSIIFPHSVSASIVEQSCRGLHAAHELRDLEGSLLGLVHRDISPHNLMCTTEGNVKLLDFGVAKATEGVEATYSGSLKGKFAYLSPEQCLHQPLDRRSDIFALGIVLWELCTGQRLFKRRTELEMMQSIIRGDVPAPSSLDPTVPAALERVIMKALAGDARHRYETAEQMRQALVAAAGKSNLVLSDDQVAGFVGQVAGDYLNERRTTLQHALERKLTAEERRRLLHMTGSNSNSADSTHNEESIRTVVDRPIGEHSRSASIPPAAAGSEHRLDAVDFPKPGEIDARSTTSELRLSPTSSVSLSHSWQQGGVSGIWQDHRRSVVRFGLSGMTVLFALTLAILLWPRTAAHEAEHDHSAILIGDPLPIGWAPTVDVNVLVQEVRPLHRYLEITTGRPMPMVVAQDYGDLARMLHAGEVAFAMMPPLLYVRAKAVEPAITLLAIKEFDESTSSDALLLVSMSAKIATLADLEGKRFCFVDEQSTTGYFLPREFIRRGGFDPETFVGEIHWSGDHFQGMRDLLSGKCDATATYSGAFLSADKFGIRVGQMRQLAITGHVPQDIVAAGSNVDPVDRERVQKAVLDFNPREHLGVDRLGDNQRITGFSPASEEAFDVLRRAVNVEQAREDSTKKP